MRDRREFSAIAAMIVMALALEPHTALADMLSSLRENTLGCGMDFFYFSRDGSVLGVGWGRETGPRILLPLVGEGGLAKRGRMRDVATWLELPGNPHPTRLPWYRHTAPTRGLR